MMAISAISTASPTPAAALSGLGVTATDSGTSGGFADLFSSQLGGGLGNIVKQMTASLANGKGEGQDKDVTADLASQPSDPALAFLLSMPAMQTTQTKGLEAHFDSSVNKQTRSLLVGNRLNDQTNAVIASNPSGAQAGLTTDSSVSTNGAITAALQAASAAKLDKTPILSEKANALTAPAPYPASAGALMSQDILPTNGKVLSATGDETTMAANLAATSETLPGTPESNLLAANTSQDTRKTAQTNTEVSTPLHSSAWASDFGEKIVWVAKSDVHSAQININPPQLGPIQISLQINGDQASAQFASPHPEVRQIIESSLPQLKEMLSSAGINLGQANVGQNMSQQTPENPFQSANGNRLTSENAILPGNINVADSTISPQIQRGRGMVDLFA